jgi:hypothetical protein
VRAAAQRRFEVERETRRMHREYPNYRATLMLDRIAALEREFFCYQPAYPELLGDDVDVFIANRVDLSAQVVGELRAMGRRAARRHLVDAFRLPASFSFAHPNAGDDDLDPQVALIGDLERVAAVCAYLERQVNRDGTLARTVRGPNGAQRDEPTIAARLLGEWHDRQVRTVMQALRAEITPRRATPDADLRVIVDVFVAAMGELDMDPAQARAVISRHARQIGADATPDVAATG